MYKILLPFNENFIEDTVQMSYIKILNKKT